MAGESPAAALASRLREVRDAPIIRGFRSDSNPWTDSSDLSMTKIFSELDSNRSEPDTLFDKLAQQLAEAGKIHELFDARLMQCRHQLGLPLDRRGGLDELAEPLRSQVEEAYLEACREVGQLFVESNSYREAWMYLRPTGDKERIRTALERTVATEENIEELIEVALHEGVAPERGIAWMLGHYGTCNSISTFEGIAGQLTADDQQRCATVLVKHLYQELRANVLAHIERQQAEAAGKEDSRGSIAAETDLSEADLAALLEGRAWLFQNESYHIDTSHLAATVRFARLVTDPQVLQLALEMTEYGRRLARIHQYPGEEPFVDVFPSHRLFFSATLGERIDEAVRFFAKKADEVPVEEFGTGAIEAYLILLTRLGRDDDALAETIRLVPKGVSLSSYAPSSLDLARRSGAWDRYLQYAHDRDDPIAYAAGLIESAVAAVSVGPTPAS